MTNGNPFMVLCAASSRIVQLQSTRYTENSTSLQPVVTRPENGRYVTVAHWIIDVLMERVIGGDNGYISISIVEHDIRSREHTVTSEEIAMVAKFLAQDIAFYYQEDMETETSTRSMTKLLDYHVRSERIRLTDASRLLFRVVGDFKEWMFEDKEIEKIVRAIKTHEFHQVPKFAENNLVMFSSLIAEITRMQEQSDFDELALKYFERREQYQETLALSLGAAKEAIKLLGREDIRAEARVRCDDNPSSTLTLRMLTSIVNEVIASIESLSRCFVNLIQLIQQPRGYRLGVLDFKTISKQFAISDISEATLSSWVNSQLGWHQPNHIASTLDFSHQLHIPLQKKVDTVFTISSDDQDRRLLDWVERHAEKIKIAISKKPKTLHELIAQFMQEGTLSRREDVFDLFSVTFDTYKVVDDIVVRFSESRLHQLETPLGETFSVSEITLSRESAC